jgi:hypothetical protein
MARRQHYAHVDNARGVVLSGPRTSQIVQQKDPKISANDNIIGITSRVENHSHRPNEFSSPNTWSCRLPVCFPLILGRALRSHRPSDSSQEFLRSKITLFANFLSKWQIFINVCIESFGLKTVVIVLMQIHSKFQLCAAFREFSYRTYPLSITFRRRNKISHSVSRKT